jgi:hypothetical protein
MNILLKRAHIPPLLWLIRLIKNRFLSFDSNGENIFADMEIVRLIIRIFRQVVGDKGEFSASEIPFVMSIFLFPS